MSRGARRLRRTGAARVLLAVWLGLAACLGLLTANALAATGSWSDQLADLPGAAQLAGGGRGATVAVLDTWVDVGHPDFAGRVLAGVTCARGHCTPGADHPDACDPHGTHVTGIVASSRYGVAPDAKVLPIRVLTDHSGSCAADAADVALGIRYAISQHVKIINVSLGSTFPLEDPGKVLPSAVTAAKAAGDLVVVAAGNGKANAKGTYGKDALTVAALTATGDIASYSQRGAGVDIAAPGGDAPAGNCDPTTCVVSTWQDGGYASDAGTSMAAPFVSGTAALLLSQDPRRTTDEARKIILATTQPQPGTTDGRLDILAAVRLHAPKDKLQNGTDSAPGSADPGSGPNPSASIIPAPGAGLARDVRRAPSNRAASNAAPAAKKSKIGPVQLLGILVVGGVGLAFVTVSGQRALQRGARGYSR